MEFECTEKNNGSLLVEVKGDLDVMGATLNKEKIITLLKENKEKKLTMDMSKVKYIDSTGIGLLIAIFRESKKSNIDLTFSNFNENVFKVLKMTNLDKALPIEF